MLASLYRYDWPGNVRELQNVLQRYATIGRLDFTSTGIADSALREAIQDVEIGLQGPGLQEALESLEKQLLIKTLEQHHWHRGKTAATLGIPRRSLQRKMKKYGLMEPILGYFVRTLICLFFSMSYPSADASIGHFVLSLLPYTISLHLNKFNEYKELNSM